MDLLTVRHLTFSYPNRSTPALRDISFSMCAGEFFVLLGRSGSGKTTLLRQLKPQLTPHGTLDGCVLLQGNEISSLPQKKTAAAIGFVQQNPQDQIVTDTVWHELAFAAESLGMVPEMIRRRVAETAAFFGIEQAFHKKTHELSGGQMQLLNLAAAMVLQPDVLILDEPTAQLDPIAADAFFSMLQKINRELGVAILMTEHRLEQSLALATKAAVLEDGALLCCDTVQNVGAFLKASRHPLFAAMPAAMQVWGSVDSALPCPLSVPEGRRFLETYLSMIRPQPVPVRQTTPGDPVLNVREVSFAYDTQAVLRDCSFSAGAGECVCILGGNGAGKSTLLSLISGQLQPADGMITRNKTTTLLPQQVQTLFVKQTVQAELMDALPDVEDAEKKRRVDEMMALCELRGLEQCHPFDLSGGEQQRVGLAKVLLTDPEILLLDEPTKGFDTALQTQLAKIFSRLKEQQVCILMVSHDVEFCAQHADRCMLLFDGAIVSEGPPQVFFKENQFYTTSAARMARGKIENAVTAAQIISSIGGCLPSLPDTDAEKESTQPVQEKRRQAPLPRWRKVCAGLSAMGALLCFVMAVRSGEFSGLSDVSAATQLSQSQLLWGGGLFLSILLLAVFTARKQTALPQNRLRQKLPRRTIIGSAVAIVLIPAVLWFGTTVLQTRQYYITALLVLLLAMLPFFLFFEGRRPKARELTLLATLCALAIAGRAAFFMLPQCKPVLAITILSGVALGAESGFLVGAVTMLLSNLLFSQGAWTPWQMFAMGLIGCLAGLFARAGWLRRSRLSLCIFGAVSAIVIYGGIMNPAAALIWGGEALNRNILLTYYITGFPIDCIHAAATALFLWFLANPMLDTLDRVREKYGIFA